MKRLRMVLSQAILVALLLLTVGGSVATAGGGLATGGATTQTTAFPDDPGYGP